MDWEVWKWLDDGHVEFRVHAVSRPARIPNPIIRLGFHLLRGREREAFLDSTKQRMRTFTELALNDGDRDRTIRNASVALTARTGATPTRRTTRWRRTSGGIRRDVE